MLLNHSRHHRETSVCRSSEFEIGTLRLTTQLMAVRSLASVFKHRNLSMRPLIMFFTYSLPLFLALSSSGYARVPVRLVRTEVEPIALIQECKEARTEEPRFDITYRAKFHGGPV